MLFNSVEFIFYFLPVALGGSFLLAGFGQKRAALAWLTVCSLVFYGWFRAEYVLLIVASTLLNYFLGRQILEWREGGRTAPAKALLVAGLVINLGSLAYFKYCNFFIDSMNTLFGFDWVVAHVFLPLGISFFTFQKVAYLVDCHAGIAPRASLLEFGLFVTYFPQLIAGPIVHPGDLLPQFQRDDVLKFQRSRFVDGAALFLLGLGKKVILADQFGLWADEGFGATGLGHNLSLLPAWAAALSYTFQLYFDFSGYSDMAMGLARMSGLELPLNFNSPYKATSIIDFWRRWHITLSRLLRDYLYIPLGGSRQGGGRRWLNLFLTMLIGGLWHGAAWTFVFWGGLHGLYLALNHAWRSLREKAGWTRDFGPAGHALAWLLTFLSVVVAWVFFRAPDFPSALRVLRGMAGGNGVAVPAAAYERLPELLRFGWLEPVGKVPYLVGGSLAELFTLSGFLALGFGIALGGRHLHEMTPRGRLFLLTLVFALTLQRVLVSRAPSTFLYFQF